MFEALCVLAFDKTIQISLALAESGRRVYEIVSSFFSRCFIGHRKAFKVRCLVRNGFVVTDGKEIAAKY